MQHTARAPYKPPYKRLGLLVGALAWLYAGSALIGAYVDTLWSDPPPLLLGASGAWLLVGAVAVVWLHIHLLTRVWRGDAAQ